MTVTVASGVARTLVGVVAPRVFVSYVHESERHRATVLAFATFLREQGVDAVLDVWSAGARHDWYAWAIREMIEAVYVLVIASPKYRAVGDGSAPADEHRGVQCEATLLRDVVYGDRVRWTPKVLPVLLPGHGVEDIPRFLSPHTTSHYAVSTYTVTGAEDLLRVVHGRPSHVAPPVSSPPDLPPRDLPPVSVTWCADMLQASAFRPGCVEVHLVPEDRVGQYSPDEVRNALDAVFDRGVTVLETGQRSAWFTPSGSLPAELANAIGLLVDLDLPRPTSWIPAIGSGSTRVVAPPLADENLWPAELAAELADRVLAEQSSASATTDRVTNVISGNVSGTVIQAGDIHGGVHF